MVERVSDDARALGRGMAWLTVALIVGGAFLAGPLVGGDLTAASQPEPSPGTGTASVEIVDAPPASVSLERADFGAGSYHLDGPPAVVSVDAVRGAPVLTYAVDVPELWFSDVHTYPLRGRAGERLRLAFGPTEISPAVVEEDTYAGTVTIWMRADGGEYRTVYERDITVRVEGAGDESDGDGGGDGG